MPSVMQTISGIPRLQLREWHPRQTAAAQRSPSHSRPVFFTASSTVLKTGQPSCVVPPLPGVTPPTTLVPYSAQPLAWNVPSRR
jgi:hypothetical protein